MKYQVQVTYVKKMRRKWKNEIPSTSYLCKKNEKWINEIPSTSYLCKKMRSEKMKYQVQVSYVKKKWEVKKWNTKYKLLL